jgi:hypothetical protein
MIRPSTIVADVFELVEHPGIVAALGANFETRFGELAKCVILEDTRSPGIAVFRPEWLKHFRALYLDVEEDNPFAWAVFSYLFKEMKATKLTFYSFDKEAGQRYRAVSLGATWMANDGRWYWELTPAEFWTAVAERAAGDDRKRVRTSVAADAPLVP